MELIVVCAVLGLAALALARGDPAEAVSAGRQAAAEFGAMGTPLFQAEALTLLSKAYTAMGDAAAAQTTSAEAAALRITSGTAGEFSSQP